MLKFALSSFISIASIIVSVTPAPAYRYHYYHGRWHDSGYRHSSRFERHIFHRHYSSRNSHILLTRHSRNKRISNNRSFEEKPIDEEMTNSVQTSVPPEAIPSITPSVMPSLPPVLPLIEPIKDRSLKVTDYPLQPEARFNTQHIDIQTIPETLIVSQTHSANIGMIILIIAASLIVGYVGYLISLFGTGVFRDFYYKMTREIKNHLEA